MTAQAIDDVLAGSFPASDPPAWTPGIARLTPRATPTTHVAKAPAHDDTKDRRADAIDLSRPADDKRTLMKGLVSLLGAIGLVLLLPFALLAIITPVALALRGVLDVAARLLALIG